MAITPFGGAGNALAGRLAADPRLTALVAGGLLGGGAALMGLLTAVGGPLIGFGAAFGIAAGLFVLTNLMAGLYVMIGVVLLAPFATLPVRFALTPTFIDVALGGFLLVYVFQWMTRRRAGFRFAPVQLLIGAFALYCIFSFVAGLGHAVLTTSILRKFVELLLAMLTGVVLVDVVRDAARLRRVTWVLVLFGAAQALIGIGLYVLPSDPANRLLNTLARFGYPSGNVLRFVEDNPDLGERAIGTWVDPNAYGGVLVILGAVAITAALSAKGRARWLPYALTLPLIGALLLTQSRGAWLAFAAAGLFLAVVRFRWLLIVGAVGVLAFFTLPFTQSYVERLAEGLGGQDLATQMRFGEYQDSLRLIGRYPLIGVGFAGSPDRDIYLGVSSTYLKLANSTGLIGLAFFVLILLGVFRYGFRHWRAMESAGVLTLWLGFAAALVGVMVSGVVDHYYFNIEFHGVAMIFWTVIGLAVATTRLSLSHDSADALQ